jgi:LysM repeat protein
MAVLSGVAAVHFLAIGALSLTGGCKTQEVLKERPYIPAPTDTPLEQPATPVAVEPIAPAIPEIKTEPIKYTVKSGDSFWKIAREYGVSKEELAAYNKMSLQKPLKIGATLIIPPGGAPVSPEKLASRAKAAPGKAARPSDGSYTVGSNDSLWKIAAKYNIKTDALAAANNLDPKKPLQIGQKLVIPEAGARTATAATTKVTAPKTGTKVPDAGLAPVEPVKAAGPSDEEKLLNELEGKAPSAVGTSPAAAASTATYAEHEVSDGDTVEDIAAMYGLKTDDIRKANPGLPADGKLKTPMILKVPESR